MFDNNGNTIPEREAMSQSQFTPGFNDSNSITIRLDTDGLKQKIYMYLKGMAYTYKPDANGNLKRIVSSIGNAKANDVGLQGIMMFVEQVINSQVVQGNTSEEDFGKLMYDFRTGISRDVWINLYKYGVDETEYDGIIDSVCLMAKPFLSRTIENGERESYGKSWQIRDSNTTLPAKRRGILSFLPVFGNGGKSY